MEGIWKGFFVTVKFTARDNNVCGMMVFKVGKKRLMKQTSVSLQMGQNKE